MKKITKILMLSGAIVPTIAIASTITSCGSKPSPDPSKPKIKGNNKGTN